MLGAGQLLHVVTSVVSDRLGTFLLRLPYFCLFCVTCAAGGDGVWLFALESGFTFLIPVLGVLLAVSIPRAMQGEGQILAVGHWPGWRCQECPVPTALGPGCDPLSSQCSW